MIRFSVEILAGRKAALLWVADRLGLDRGDVGEEPAPAGKDGAS